MNLFSILGRRFWNWSSPDLSGVDDARALAARALQPVLVGAILWTLIVLAVGIPFFAVRKLPAVIFCLLYLSISFAAILLLRRGRIKPAGGLFLSVSWILATILNVFSGGVSSNSLLVHIPLIVIAAWLLGHRSALICGYLFLGQSLLMTVMASMGIHCPKYFPGPPVMSWLVLILFVAIGILPLNQVLQALGGALTLARQRVVDLERTDQALRESEQRLRAILEVAPDGIFFADASGHFIEVNEAACRQLRYTREQLLKRNALDILGGEHAEFLDTQIRESETCVTRYESRYIRSDATKVPVELGLAKLEYRGQPGFVVVARDITDRKSAEAEQARLEAGYRQAQKMESVGRLAGGVAHDFNNLINVIKGYTELLLEKIAWDDPEYEDLKQIEKAADRAASLTSQLLAFSRKQILQPKTLNLNEAVTEMSAMLRRLIGEDINLVVVTPRQAGLIYADPGQLQQIIMNLALNARDAMPRGGKLIIEAANVEFDEEHIRTHPMAMAKPGPYVMLAISDNGIGMDEETRSRIFEPFFTTKEKGKGTGLGLSTVYGIVKQSNGFIWVYSEPGKGTTFKIYFPRIGDQTANLKTEDKPECELGGHETVLVVEDEVPIRAMTSRILRERGYVVLEAADGMDALRLAEEYGGQLHLLLTDVVMPGMSGKQLVSKLETARPGIKALYMSGYAENAIVHHGVLDSDIAFLPKPFAMEDLVRKVREVISS